MTVEEELEPASRFDWLLKPVSIEGSSEDVVKLLREVRLSEVQVLL